MGSFDPTKLPPFSPGKLNFSLLILKPRAAFFERVKASLAAKGPGPAFEQVYFPEEDSVWLVPMTGQYGGEGRFEAFLEHLKPRMLRAEFGKFGVGLVEPATVGLFDQCFELLVRDEAKSAYDLLAPQWSP